MSIAFCSGQYSNIIVLCRGLGKGMTSPFKWGVDLSEKRICFKIRGCRLKWGVDLSVKLL